LKRLDCLKNLKNKNILEIGFGTGDLLKLISLKNSSNVFVGIEISSIAVHNLKKERPTLLLCCGSAENLPFLSNSFDVIIASHVLEHVERDESAVSEIARILKVAGIAIVAVPIYTDSSLHYRHYTVKSLELLFKRYNLDLIYIKPHNSILTKLIDKIIAIFFPRYPKNGAMHVNDLIKKIYYNAFVPFRLALDRIDDLFAYVDPWPIQVVAVFKKKR
jgi:ubiquinone/menaquinone biosynthesis C-methylase UbiE